MMPMPDAVEMMRTRAMPVAERYAMRARHAR